MINKKHIILLNFLLCVMLIFSGCTFNVSTDHSVTPNSEDYLVSQTVKNGLEKGFNFSYEATTGMEGHEYFTKEFNEKHHITKEYQDLIIGTRKREKIIRTMEIREINNITVKDNSASATTIFHSTSKGTTDKWNFNDNGEIKVELIKINNKWLINDIQVYTYKQ
ncbi:hypothetical protein [Clostridium botulinum]|uniref:hypothetical protein n=1 Tax=Clostridium botulinum TaxID=1491 RepID=UPI000D132FC1|nr:hypothetical protein [Clostridium botulinum]AVQ46116.1 hypothetical protein C7M60_10075 [Clostridium botulinum]AVQ49733.1 hypothetical protein C7M58_10455 [Clostridium botulinum]